MEVKPVRECDFERVHSIFKTVFDRTKWEQDFVVAWTTRIQEASIGAYSEDGKLLAYAILTVKDDPSRGNYWFLEFLAVDPEAQGLGLGTILLQTLLKKNPNIALVPLNNEKLIEWYKRHGFRILSKKTDKYGDPELFMSSIGVSNPANYLLCK